MTAIDSSYFNELYNHNSLWRFSQTLLYNFISKVRITLNLKIRTRLINSINKNLRKHHLLMSGIIQEISSADYNIDDINEIYPVVSDALNEFRRSHTKLEKLDFLNNEDTRVLSKVVLKDLYKIESIIRRKMPTPSVESFADEKKMLQGLIAASV